MFKIIVDIIIISICAIFSILFFVCIKKLRSSKSRNNKFDSFLTRQPNILKPQDNDFNYKSYKHTLTKLDNRKSTLESLDKVIQSSYIANKKFGLLIIDLVKYDDINNSYGYEIKNLLLTKITKRLMQYNSKNNMVYSQDRCEFIIICKNISNEEELITLANNIINNFNKVIYIKSIPCKIELGIGGVLYPDYGKDKLTLMRKADLALFSSKLNSINRFNLYKEDVNIYENLKLRELIKNALINKEFVLFYQPQFNIDTHEIIGVEALIRWINKDLGLILPNKFLPLAKEIGLMMDIGDWVIESVFSQLKEWNELYDSNLRICINISSIQLLSKDFVEKIISNLKKFNINPNFINLELSEKSAFNNIKLIKTLRNFGFKISIDNFSGSYSSFKYLSLLPLDTLKIDISLLKDVNTSNEHYEIIKTIINICEKSNINIIAKGIENKEQLLTLKYLKCNGVQGYYYEKPLKIVDLERIYFR